MKIIESKGLFLCMVWEASPSIFEKKESFHADFVVSEDTRSCHNDNFRCRQWRQSWHHDKSWFSIILLHYIPSVQYLDVKMSQCLQRLQCWLVLFLVIIIINNWMDMLWQAIANMFSTKGGANIQREWIAFYVLQLPYYSVQYHDDVIKWRHFPCYWKFVRGIHRSPVNSPHIGQWRGALVFSLICVRINGWVNNRMAGDLRRHRVNYDVIVMITRTLKNRVHIWATNFNPK